MIGQGQVTEPLMTALRNDRVGHAYLFSGPRGCGKTTSARILARCLNCAQGPTDTPCGRCDSCVELSRAGGGSLDVVEIDAASHNGVDDARDLRERAIFAPARDRYKIFILDEAHMVTQQGFNALLKLVEEPPDHVKFIFATTEPDKVLGTIRSRTHHYPFRLVPPGPMLAYVGELCASEGVEVEQGVLPLVVRAGGGSPRDTLSLLDQLIAGSDQTESGTTTVRYERAVALLGYTHAELLDAVVEALAAEDAAAAFGAVDRVVQTGQDPRRFVDDLLERLRDLIVVAATGEGAAAVLRGVPADELERMGVQAQAFGSERLSRVADLVSQALDDMTGATSPRLHLELMIARVLAAGGARASAGGAPVAAPAAAPAAAEPAPAAAPAPTRSPAAEASPVATPGPLTLDRLSAAWPDVLARLEGVSRTSWMIASGARIIDVERAGEHDVVILGFGSQSDLTSFKPKAQGGADAFIAVRQAIQDVTGVHVRFKPRLDSDGGSGGVRPSGGGGSAGPDAGRPGSSGQGSKGPSTPSAPSAGPVTEWAVAPIPGGGSVTGPAPSSGTSASVVSASTPPTTVAAAPAPPVESPRDEWARDEWVPVDAPPPDEWARDHSGWAQTAASAVTTVAPAPPLAVDAEPEDAPYERPGDTRASAIDGVVLDPEVPLDEDDREDTDDSNATSPVAFAASAPHPASAPQRASAPRPDRPAPADRVDRSGPTAVVSDGIARYGEAVVRQVLGARFVREEPFEAPTRFS